MKSSAGKIQLAGFDDLFQTTGSAEPDARQMQEIPLTELFPFKGHPFQVRDDDAMRKMAESIAECGVLSAGFARPRPEGGYEIISGHRRKHGCELAGKETMPVKERLTEMNLPWTIFALSRNAVHTAQQFKDTPGSVLLATGTAWEGFDFPGDCVSLLVIPRLPFSRPDALKEKNGPNIRISIPSFETWSYLRCRSS